MNNNNQILFLSKLYAWCIFFEPLLFFIVTRSVGFNLTPAKVLELLFVFFFLLFVIFPLNTSKSFRLKLPDFNSFIYGFIYLYIFSLLISTIFGWLLGGYQIDLSFYQSGDFSQQELNTRLIVNAFRGISIIIFYFFFFTFLASVFLNTRENLEYFFINFRRVFLFCLLVGYVDYFIIASVGYDLVPRHIYDNLSVGSRFHGFAGEPRQAGVYLLFGLGVFYLESLLFKRPVKKYIFFLTILAAFLTTSITLLVALFIFVLLILPLYLFRFELKKVLSIFLIISTFLSIAVFTGNNLESVAEYFPRVNTMQGYYDAFVDIWFILESKAELPYFVKIQLGEIYPLYDFISMLRNGEFLSILFGSGPGSAALNNYSYVDILMAYGNPNSYGIILLYESGIVGTIIYFLAFFTPIKILASSFRSTERSKLYTYMALVLSASLALKSPTIYIFLGLVISTLMVIQREEGVGGKEP
jgi:hypothetical protein